jgi:predicted PurR-regulated permease PerM
LTALAAAIVAAMVVAALYLGRVIFIPLALGIILSFLLQPVVRLLERTGLPRVPAVLMVVVLVAVVLTGIGWNVGRQLQGLAHELRSNQTYIRNIESKIADLQRFGARGALADLQATLDRVVAKFQAARPDEPERLTVTLQPEPQSQWAVIAAAVTPLLGPLAMAALVIVLVIFMLISREDLRNRLIGLFGHGRLSVTTRALDDAGQRIGRYLLMQLLINASYGLALGLMLFVIGVPFALLWGFVAALLRYVPYIGPWLGAAFPVVTSLVAFEPWSQPLLVIALIVALELFSNMVMEPLLYGHSVGISPVALIMAAALWTLLWGPIGLVMATPLTVCLVVLGQHVPQFRFFVVLLGDEPALSLSIRYYQRLLARDRHEAVSLAHEHFDESKQSCEVSDHVLLPALVRTRKDRARELITAEDEAFIFQTTREVIAELAQPVTHSNSNGGLLQRLTANAATLRQQVTVSRENGASKTAAAAPVEGTEAEGTTPDTNFSILGCPAHHESEELALEMLKNALASDRHKLHALTTKVLPTEIIDLVRQQRPKVVFLAVIPPSGLSQASYLCRRLRKLFPNLPIVVGYWGNKNRFDEVLVKLRSRGASFVTTSICQSQKQIAALAEIATATEHRGPVRSAVHAKDSDD